MARRGPEAAGTIRGPVEWQAPKQRVVLREPRRSEPVLSKGQCRRLAASTKRAYQRESWTGVRADPATGRSLRLDGEATRRPRSGRLLPGNALWRVQPWTGWLVSRICLHENDRAARGHPSKPILGNDSRPFGSLDTDGAPGPSLNRAWRNPRAHHAVLRNSRFRRPQSTNNRPRKGQSPEHAV